MKKFLLALFICSVFIPGISFAQTLDTDCQFECKNEYRSAKFECSENWAGPEQKSNKDYCMNDAQNSYQRCLDSCVSS
ncbi:MAG: hypothetical protein ACR2NC_04090 [Thermodesulfobacteriota bacterium]